MSQPQITAPPDAQHSVQVDAKRRRIGNATDRQRKAALGQFMTPAAVARFMASLLPPLVGEPMRLLDAGAGIGSLTSAVLDRQVEGSLGASSIHVTAFELDPFLVPHLTDTLQHYAKARKEVTFDIVASDFLQAGVIGFKLGNLGSFTHAILNPPYKKITSHSIHRELLKKVGLETVNLYSGFVGLSLLLMEQGGSLCAIIPRSFCNGPYYKPFRELILTKGAIRRVHLFASRTHAFSDDDVLQENVIIVIERGGSPGEVTLSTSSDATFADLETWTLPPEAVVKGGDADLVIHLPTSGEADGIIPPKFSSTLAQLGLKVSTGPVVDFRLRDHLRAQPEPDTVLLLYPTHFVSGDLQWPKAGIKKPNAIALNPETQRWLYPAGNYAVVRRFSSKEERRRVVASFIAEDSFASDFIALENHLNVFHAGRRGLPRLIALGLGVYLNSTIVDAHFRTFNSHTQVNATDLRMLPYPDADVLTAMGRWSEQQNQVTQEAIDRCVEKLS